jgi:hypothetical protein
MTTPQRLELRNTGRKDWGTELAPALAQPELADVSADTEPARRAAYWLAVVLGNCRLRGFDLGKEDGTLSVSTALAAGRRLASLLPQWTEEAQRLEERLDTADRDVEANDLCFDLLEARMEAWSAFVAIDEAYQACLVESSAQHAEFATLIDRLLDQTEELDRQMQDQLVLLSMVAHYPLLENWRRLLTNPYDQVRPWWLDGSLETAFEQTQGSLLSDWSKPRCQESQEERFHRKWADENNILPFVKRAWAISATDDPQDVRKLAAGLVLQSMYEDETLEAEDGANVEEEEKEIMELIDRINQERELGSAKYVSSQILTGRTVA